MMNIHNSPTISVILPVFNSDQYIELAINSILNQSFNDFELIVIDDGSSDNSFEILSNYAKLDARIHLIRRDNQGLIYTLNQAIELAKGQYIARMDADDLTLPNRLESQLEFLEKNKLHLCGSSVQLIGAAIGSWHYPPSHEGCEIELLFGVPFAHPSVMGHSSVFKELRYSSEWSLVEDYDLWQRAWAAGFKMGNVPEVLLQYRVHRKQTSSLYRWQQAQNSQRIRSRHWQQLLSAKLGISPTEAQEAEKDLWKTFQLLRQLKQCYKGTEAEKILHHAFPRLCSHRLHSWVLDRTS
ncbi:MULTISPECIES: glycosyltransferase [unclassified Thermosynechococcus]|uniref:glycosyltransferase family 2 protein n=1 Tax=unclassified Thermosynechococcus TaxID=2622553 RepID=UPI0019817F0D|nr:MULTISPECIES: glycosyltransferase [unclassified Thermosynechococcus]QSF50257.1 glycosyltransferase [Thermosynechococcus sp. TA-1]WNC23379.1 glycosyltransferase [Thermosynechococcus sp. PP22]WNC33618.1 glycosyltransferase [Thermosynechococcus sp. PKX95]WNC36140.1 glycosyltransferase [Thermosynechococcus sp. PKX91]WNC38665.1 glycosyltransferase [Thermosynechococcus sp. WL11]